MATIVEHTVKPAGGGDYATLAAWDVAQRRDLVAADEIEKAVCYDGGDLGYVTLGANWTSDSTRYPWIYVPQDERHQLQPGSGAFIQEAFTVTPCIYINGVYARVSGIRGISTPAIHLHDPLVSVVDAGSIIEDCYYELHGVNNAGVLDTAATLTGFYYFLIRVPTDTLYVKNCVAHLIHAADPATNQDISFAYTDGGIDNPSEFYFYNCLEIITHWGVFTAAHSGYDVLIMSPRGTIQSCASLQPQYPWSTCFTGLAAAVATSDNNCSSDSSATMWGGADHLTLQLAANAVRDPTNDLRQILAAASIFYDAGLDLAPGENDYDWEGTARPQFNHFDIGPDEYSLPGQPGSSGGYTADSDYAFDEECFPDSDDNTLQIQDWSLVDDCDINDAPDPIWEAPIFSYPLINMFGLHNAAQDSEGLWLWFYFCSTFGNCDEASGIGVSPDTTDVYYCGAHGHPPCSQSQFGFWYPIDVPGTIAEIKAYHYDDPTAWDSTWSIDIAAIYSTMSSQETCPDTSNPTASNCELLFNNQNENLQQDDCTDQIADAGSGLGVLGCQVTVVNNNPPLGDYFWLPKMVIGIRYVED